MGTQSGGRGELSMSLGVSTVCQGFQPACLAVVVWEQGADLCNQRPSDTDPALCPPAPLAMGTWQSRVDPGPHQNEVASLHVTM